LRKIDDYLMDFLRDNNWGLLKKMIGFGKIKVEPSAFIGNKRNVDLLVTILNYHGNKTQKVAVEIENDRGFDVDAVLRKIKKDQPCPTNLPDISSSVVPLPEFLVTHFLIITLLSLLLKYRRRTSLCL